MADRIWILGAPDPEMEMIERLLRACGEHVEYATVWRDGARRRVTPAEAYAPDVEIGEGLRGLRATAYMVECAPAVLVGSSMDGIDWAGTAITIDHHRPGDPGYGRPPAEFLSASSIGQVIEVLARTRITSNLFDYRVVLDNAQWSRIEAGTHHDHMMSWGCDDDRIPDVEVESYSDLGDPLPTVVRLLEQPWPMPFAWVAEIGAYIISTPRGSFELGGAESWHVVPHDFVLVAAADHCLAAAYRGECPGVDPDALMRWRAASRAAFQRRAVEDVLADVERAREALMDAPVVRLSPEPWEPACGVHGRTGDTLAVVDMRGQYIPELPEAAARDGVCFIASLTERDGRIKVVCQSGTPEQIKAFMRVWAPAQGLTDIYGDPARGFAGGYKDSER